MADFKQGDVVQLKSGGPKMTIKGIGKYGIVPKEENALCEWFDGNRRVEDVFELAVLMKADTSSGFGQLRVERG